MILLANDCLLFRLASGESVPLRPEMISFEVCDSENSKNSILEAEIVNHAAAAVFHYFKHELGRDWVSMGEFTLTLEKVLRGLEMSASAATSLLPNRHALETDLQRLANESGSNELFFFSGLRRELRERLRQSPALLRFHGLRSCVKQLSGSRRWSIRCQNLRDQIVEYLRDCLKAEASDKACSLRVE